MHQNINETSDLILYTIFLGPRQTPKPINLCENVCCNTITFFGLFMKTYINFSLQGDLGPFNPGLPVDVPVWLALNLKQRQKCRILPPEWMDVGRFSKAYKKKKSHHVKTKNFNAVHACEVNFKTMVCFLKLSY